MKHHDPEFEALPREIWARLPLNPRQKQVALGIMQGRTTKEIARRCGCDYRTVETYRLQIRERLGIRCARDVAPILAAEITRHWAATLVKTAIVFARAFP